MSKQDEHWCDRKHMPSDKKFGIGDLSEKLYNDLEGYLLHDVDKRLSEINVDESKITSSYIERRFNSILDNAENLEMIVKDANSVYPIYHGDYLYRRQRWLEAKGICQRLICQCNHMSNLTVKRANIQKYVDCGDLAKTIQGKVYNLMKSDDCKRKRHARVYDENEENINDENVPAGI